MNLFGTLRVSGEDDLGVGALRQGLLGQASHSASALSRARVESTTDGTSDISRVSYSVLIVRRDSDYFGSSDLPLSSNIVGTKGRLEGLLEGRTNSRAHITELCGSTGKDVGHGLANTAGDIVLGAAAKAAAEATTKARETTELRNSKGGSKSAGSSEAGNEEGLHVARVREFGSMKDRLSECRGRTKVLCR